MLDRYLRRRQARRPPHRVVLSESKPPKFSLSFDTAEIEPGAYDVMLLPGGRWILGKVGCESHLELFCWDYFALNQEAEEDDTLLSPIARIRFEPFSLGDKEGYAKFYPSPQFDYIDKSVNILVHSPSSLRCVNISSNTMRDLMYVSRYELIQLGAGLDGVMRFQRRGTLSFPSPASGAPEDLHIKPPILDGDLVCIPYELGILVWNWREDTRGLLSCCWKNSAWVRMRLEQTGA